MINEPDFVLWHKIPDLELFRFIDLESSGLILGSYPIQYGWCGFDLKPKQILIRPLPHWTNTYFDPASVAIHGFERDYLVRKGVDAFDVARIVNDALGNCLVLSDNKAWDTLWSDRLFDDTDIPPSFVIENIFEVMASLEPLYDEWCFANKDALFEKLDEFYPHTHKADADCLRLAAMSRMLIDRPWSEWLLTRSQ